MEFLQSLKDKAKGIRFSWFRGMEMTDEDKMYVLAVEDILKSVIDASVTYDKEEIEKADKQDGFEL